MTGEEIERKFLINTELETILKNCHLIRNAQNIEQRYIGGTGDWSIRLRSVIDKGDPNFSYRYFITMKRKITALRCVELEDEVTNDFYNSALGHCAAVIHKTRYTVESHGSEWHIDQFTNPELNGLVTAEIELLFEDAVFVKPSWLGDEVTNDPQYRNFKLVERCTKL